jgi:hypothetical protein
MQVTGGFPPGEYSEAILEGIWPAATPEHPQTHHAKRSQDAGIEREYAELQRRLRLNLAGQEGVTAERLMHAHDVADKFHQTVADGHETKADCYVSAKDVYQFHLRELRDIAREANQKIKQIQQSKKPEPVKIAEITKEATKARTYALHRHAAAVTNVTDLGQRVLTKTGQDGSIHGLIQALGYDTTLPQTGPNMPQDGGGLAGANPYGSGGALGAVPSSTAVSASANLAAGGSPGSVPTAAPAGGVKPPAPPVAAAPIPSANVLSPNVPTPPVPSAPASLVPPSAAPLSPGGLAATGGQALAPGNLASGIQTNMTSGIPVSVQPSIAANAVAGAAAAAAQIPPVVPPAVVPPVVVPAIPHMVVSPPMVVDDVGGMDHSAASSVNAHMPASVVAPVVPVAPVGSMSAPEPAGPLPAYGSDIRLAPSASTMPAAPPQVSATSSGGGASAAPGPVSGLAQPAVVRQPALVSASGGSESARAGAVVMGQSAAASAGAVAGQAAAVGVEQQRCDDIVDAVARQEPRLRWAAGTRADGSTVLVTDLAGGWIPPGIGIPGDAVLLEPGSETFKAGQTIQELLGDTNFHSKYESGQQIGESPMGLSDWPRKVERVPQLARDLREAAEWRNRLPVVAHTLAKAAALGSSARPMEIDELHKQLVAQRSMVLDSYRDGAADMHAIGNWMLLAAIDAVHAGDPLLAAYHFRWFDATQAVRAE